LAKGLKVPLNAETICPDTFAGKTIDEISKLTLWEGNRRSSMNEFFKINGSLGKTPEDVTIDLYGDLSKVQRIGTNMTEGKITIENSVGMHLGEEMKGGEITVEGGAGSWVGSGMTGGKIEVKGDVGNYVGAPYWGSTRGMRGGTIHIRGNAGTEVGSYMKKGLVKVDGDVDQFVGIHMKDGGIIVRGNAKDRAGAYMTGGKIIICGHMDSVLPTFTIDNIKNKARVEDEKVKETFYLFIGDLAEKGRGKLYIAKNKNPQLKKYEDIIQHPKT
jgi:formylmethanofuran dehydrogenase subunit C